MHGKCETENPTIMTEPLQYDQSKLNAYGSLTFTVNEENYSCGLNFAVLAIRGKIKKFKS